MPLIWKVAIFSHWQVLDSNTSRALTFHWENESQGWFVSDSFQRQRIYICFPSMEILHGDRVYAVARCYVDS